MPAVDDVQVAVSHKVPEDGEFPKMTSSGAARPGPDLYHKPDTEHLFVTPPIMHFDND